MKESILKTDSRIVFKETFGSEDLVRANGGVPTGVTFSNGVGSFLLSSASRIFYNKIFSGTGSVRIKCKPTSFATLQVLFDFRDNTASPSGAYGYLNATTGQIVYAAGGTIYNRGIPSTTSYLNSDNDIVITGISLSNLRFAIGSNYATLFNFTGNFELLEIYKGTLTDNEVKNLYENRQNRELQNSNGSVYKEILRVDARNGVIANKYSGSQYTELVTNGSFDTDTTWSKGTGWSIANGVATKVAGSAANLSQPATSASKLYRVIFTISNYSAGTINAQLSGGGGGTGTSRSANGTYIEDITSGSTAGGNFYLVASPTFAGDIDNVSVKEIIPTITNTSVTTQKSGPIYAMDFNGTTSKIDCGSYNNLVGDKTFIGWIKPRGPGQTAGRIIDNGQLAINVTASGTAIDRIRTTRNYYSSTVDASSNSLLNNTYKWTLIVITSTSTGITNIFYNSVLNGTANQAGGTPVAGPSALLIGNNATVNRSFDGLMSNIRIVDGILSQQEIVQIYQSEKTNYGL